MLRRGAFSTARRRKAPVTLLSFRSVLVAVFVAALLTALAAAASPFVTTAAGSEALANRLQELSPYAAGLQIQGELSPGDPERPGARPNPLHDEAVREAAAGELAASLRLVGSPVVTLESGTMYATGASGDNPIRLMSRTGALAHVKVLSQTAGPGVWISSITAELGHLKPGDRLRGPGFDFRIKGVYRALSHSPESAYWVNLFQDIYPPTMDDPPPASYVFVEPRQLLGVVTGASRGFRFGEGLGGSDQPRLLYEFPVDPKGLTLANARVLQTRFDPLQRDLSHSSLGRRLGCNGLYASPCITVTSLSSAVLLADRNVAAVRVPVSLLADAGSAIALAVAAAAGAFLVRRRRAEAALAYARGEHVAAFATRTAVEALGPIVLGGAAGFGLAYELTGVFAPAGSTDATTTGAAAFHASIAVALGLALLVGTASAAYLRLFDTGARTVSWLKWLPWELPLLGLAIYLLVRIHSGGGLSGDASTGSAHPTLAVFVFPLLFVAAIAGLATRLVRLGLRLGAAPAARTRRIPLYLAVRRLAAARGMLIVLMVVTAVSLGAFTYAESLASSLDHTTVEKAYMATGSDAQASIAPEQGLPKSFPYPITRVEFSNQNASLDAADGVQADVMLVDPATIVGAIHWEADWGPSPAKLLQQLASAPSRPLPVIVTGDAARMHSLSAAGANFPVNVIGTVKAFPGMAQGIPLVITTYRAMNEESARVKLDDPLGVLQAYVWGKGPPLAVESAITASSMNAYYPSSIDTFLRDPNVLLATSTYSFMRTIAIAAAVLVLLGLLLYLQARQRSQVIASELGRRMGLRARAEALSVSLEVLGILVFAALVGGGIAIAAAGPVVRRIDPLPMDTPPPIFTLPWAPMFVASGCLVLVALLSGVLTSWLARRADVNQELRVA
ncbi:MAG TPA: hypothetical protein VGM80_04620 [Gaiellaceae bacterium]